MLFKSRLVGLRWTAAVGATPRATLAAENLFLQKQLALFQERKVKPRRAEDSTRLSMATVSRLVDWRTVLVVVKPDTLVRWHWPGSILRHDRTVF